MSVEKIEIETFFGRCRCCLAYGYLKNMWIEHQYDGEAEVYGEMLVQCFALTWDHSEDSMEQDQICEQCIFRLRDASDFKKVVLNSQDELLQEFENENMVDVNVKEERLDEEFLVEYKPDSEADTADSTYDETEFIMDTGDTINSVKDETEYEEIEYLEDENVTGVNDAFDTDSSQQTDQSKQVRTRKKQTRRPDHDVGAPKRKWPKKLPKSERQKTYKQYSEGDLRKCLEEVRNNVRTAADASVKYNIPKKTILAKIRAKPSDVLIDNTKKSKLERPKTKTRTKPTIFKTKASFLDEKTIKLIELNKLKAKNLTKEAVPLKKDNEIDKETKIIEIEINVEPKIEEIESPVNAEQVRTRYKAIVNDKFKKENKFEPGKHEVNEMNKHKDNIRAILQNSNATIIKGFWGTGYSCNFCNEQREIPSELKLHNFEAHSDVADDAIKVKYVSDLVIRLDITDLNCKLCNTSINSLEEFTDHLTKIHSQFIHTDIKNHIIPFKFDTENLQCAMCNKEFKYFKLLSEHMSDHYRNYECSVCERAFINKQSMQTHSYRHNKGVFKCSHCPKVFDSRPKRSVHERVVHALSNKTRKCSFCSERFATKDLVQSHEVKAHGVEPTVFSCQACNKSYHSQSSLTTHRKRYHLMLRPHKCSYCEMAFFSKIELRSHTVTHTKSRDFKCDMCAKSFGTRCSLNQHIRGHLDDRRFKCDNCERTFVHRTAWKVHMRSKHSRIV